MTPTPVRAEGTGAERKFSPSKLKSNLDVAVLHHELNVAVVHHELDLAILDLNVTVLDADSGVPDCDELNDLYADPRAWMAVTWR